MKKVLIIISCIVILLTNCDSQVKRELESIFLGFPLNGSLKAIKKYCNANGFKAMPNSYNSVLFYKKIAAHSNFKKEGNGYEIKVIVPIKRKIFKNERVISLSIYFRGDSIGVNHYSDTIGSTDSLFERLTAVFNTELKQYSSGGIIDPEDENGGSIYLFYHLNCIYPTRYLKIEKWSNMISISYFKKYPG